MSGAMKKEFAANVRKANKSAAGKSDEDVAPSSSAAASGKKRKQSGEESSAASKKTRIAIKVGDLEFSIDHESNEAVGAASKKASASAKTRTPPKSKTSATATPVSTAKPPKTPQAKNPAPQADTKANTTTKKSTEPQARSTKTATGKVTKTPNKPEPKKATVKKETKVQKEPASKENPLTIKQEVKREPSPDNTPGEAGIHPLTGVYNVSCPQLEDQAPEYADQLRLFLCVDEDAGKIWGGFELAWKSGVLLIADCSGAPNATWSFGWRTRDSQRGGLVFGRGCDGEMGFIGSGKLGGTI